MINIPMVELFAIAVLACAVSYVSVMSLVFKFQGGLFPESAVPNVVTADMRRARGFFVKLLLAALVIALLASYGLTFVLDHITWMNTVRPALGGVCFAMLYGGVTRYDRIRPRCGARLEDRVYAPHR